MKKAAIVKFLFATIALFIFCSTASAYTVFGGAFYCTNCSDCSNALNNNTLNLVYVNASLASPNASCIYNPAGFSNKILDCQGNTMIGNNWFNTYGIFVNNRNNVTIRNCNISNYNYGIRFAFSSNNTLLNNTLHSIQYQGLELNDHVNYTDVINNTAYNNQYGFSFDNNATHNNIQGNLAYDNSQYGFEFDNGFYHNIIINNTARDNNDSGFNMDSGFNNTFINNSLYNNTDFSFYIWADLPIHCQNTILNTTGGYFNKPIRYDHDTAGITIQNSAKAYASIIWCGVSNSVIKNVTITNAPGKMDGFVTAYSFNNNFTDILSHDNQFGLALYLSPNNTVTNLTVYNTGNPGAWVDYGGIFLYGSTGNIIINSTAYNNTLAGISATSFSHNTQMINNIAYGQPAGLYVARSNNCNLTNNTAYNNTAGIALTVSSNNRVINNTVWNGTYGFYIDRVSNTRFENNTAHSSSRGFSVTPVTSNSSTLTIVNNEIYNNSNFGIELINSDLTTLQNDHLYNNTVHVFVQNTNGTMRVTMLNEILDSPAGNYVNYTNISVIDTVGIGNTYFLYWWPLITPVAATATSFENTSMGITFAGSPVLDTVRWHWTDAQLNASGIPENKLTAWRSNGTAWSLVNNQALSTAANRITVTNLNTQGIFSILNYTAPPRPRPTGGGGGGGASRNSIYNTQTTTEKTPPLPVRDDALPETKKEAQQELLPPKQETQQEPKKIKQQEITFQKQPPRRWHIILSISLLLLLLIAIAIYLYKKRKTHFGK